jgi:hypothetical protein
MVSKKFIPYGVSDIEVMNRDNKYYVDKTMYIPLIERTNFVFLIRPRRFGKSLFQSTLESYYDISKGHRFEDFYKGMWIYDNPTPNRAKYMILRFNFSAVSKNKDIVEEDFNNHCNMRIMGFINDYKKYIPKEYISLIKKTKLAHVKLNTLIEGLSKSEVKMYVMIDEYDNFANSLLTEYGPEIYKKLTKEAGFFKQFFTVLKYASTSSGSGLERIYITGVSPVTMDDVTSGFNIGDNISISTEFNGVLGFTERDVVQILDYYLTDNDLKINKTEALEVMKKWYDNYYFSEYATESVFNTDAVWYFIKEVTREKRMPRELVDYNLRTDYRKLKYLLIEDRKLNGNYSKLNEIINNNGIYSEIKTSFPFDMVAEEENFVSLMFYFGLLSFTGDSSSKIPFLKIPNETIKNLVFEYIETALQTAHDFTINIRKFREMLDDMAYNGNFKPLFEYIAKNINDNTSLRDYINAQDNEHTVKMIYLKDLGMLDYYITQSERESNKGYADLWLVPFNTKYKQYTPIPYAYLIEFKYIKRDVAVETVLDKLVAEAKEQLAKYSDDLNSQRIVGLKPHGEITLKKLIIIFHGWELAYCEEA